MSITLLQGAVTHYQQSTETTDSRQTYVQTMQLLTFRVNNRPVSWRSQGGFSIGNGDQVSIMGREKAGTFEVYCIRNGTTGAIFKVPTVTGFALGMFPLLIGLPLISAGEPFVYFGIPVAALGAFFMYWWWRGVNANRVLTATRAMKSPSV